MGKATFLSGVSRGLSSFQTLPTFLGLWPLPPPSKPVQLLTSLPRPSPTPARSRTPPRATRVHPAPAALPARFQLQWGPPRAQLLPPPTPSRPEPRPAPPGIAPPLARSRGVAHFHQGLLVSPVPTPGSRRGSRTSLLPPGQTRGQYIHPTETIQAVYDLGIK